MDRRKAQPRTPQPAQPAGQTADEEEHGEQLSRRDNASGAAGGEHPARKRTEQSVPEPRSDNDAAAEGDETGAAGQPQKLPYDDPSFIAMHLARKMDEPNFFKMLQLLNRLAQDRNPEALEKVIREFTDQSAGSAR